MSALSFGMDLRPASERIQGEREQRAKLAERMLPLHVPFLDDLMRAILPHDLVLLGAETGVGKTQLAAIVAQKNALSGKRVVYFALEAEPLEIERRIKYRMIMEIAAERRLECSRGLNYADWYIGRFAELDDAVGDEVDRRFAESFSNLLTFYRGDSFTADDIFRTFLAVQDKADLIVFDHLHYVDEDGDENAAQRRIIMTVRNASLMIGVPVLCIAHLRKRNMKSKAIVPDLAEFHGSSELTKVVTRAVVLARAKDQPATSWHLSPTYMAVQKNRLSGWAPWVACADFDRTTNDYGRDYRLGRLSPDAESWMELEPGAKRPSWAKHERQVLRAA